MINQTIQPARDLRFGDLPVDARIASALQALGYTEPTPIQAQAIPILRAGGDMIGLARTGSGKTAGFGIPLIESIRTGERYVQALILTPTRELASQVAAALATLGRTSGVRVTAVYGGVSMFGQVNALRGNSHIVVGTPGRVFDHIGRGTLDLRRTHVVVLDEADRMLDVGFAPAIEKILSYTPVRRQTALFSATFPSDVEALAARHTREAVRVAVDAPGAALETLEEHFQRVPNADAKVDALHDILISPECKLALVFRRTTHRADKLVRDLDRRGFKVAVLHGRRSQSQRELALGALRKGELNALVATDIAARGLDITGLTHVINFDLPDTAENYTHRIGRTARMGADGVAITLVAPEDEADLRSIQRRLPAAPGRETPKPEPRRESPKSSQRRGVISRALKPRDADRHGSPAPRFDNAPRRSYETDGAGRPAQARRSAPQAPRAGAASQSGTPAPHYPFRSSRAPHPAR